MPGTLVQDASAVELYDGTITSKTTTNGTWKESGLPGEVSVELVTGTLSGSAATIDVEIQGADTNGGTNTVTYGRFSQLTEADGSLTLYLQARVYKPYVRAVIITGGTTVTSVPLVVTLREPHDRRTVSRTAG